MSITITISAGDGPIECQYAVVLTARKLTKAAKASGLDVVPNIEAKQKPVSSLALDISGSKDALAQLATAWSGTVKWTFQSPFRPGHKRKNWFVGVWQSEQSDSVANLNINDVRIETFRAGGPGGQHQNKTESAVRATHIPTGTSVIAKDERSQHRNRAKALERLAEKLVSISQAGQLQNQAVANVRHHTLERGNPIQCFKG